MSTSKKLSIAQLTIASLVIILYIIAIATASGSVLSFGAIASAGILLIFSFFILPAVLLIIGIVQIVFSSQESARGLFLTSGILGIVAILSLIPFLNFAIWIAIIVVNIIAIVKG